MTCDRGQRQTKIVNGGEFPQKMENYFLGIAGCFMGIFGILTNLYILIVLLWNKKTRTSSEWILLHLSWCGFAGSIVHLCFLSPSILRTVFVLNYPLCDIVGSGLLVLQLVSVWSVCALSADRAIAIVYPLRYSQIATTRRIAVYFIFVWLLSLATMMTALSVVSFHSNQTMPAESGTNTNNKEQSKYTSIPKLQYNNNNNNSNSISTAIGNGNEDYEMTTWLKPPDFGRGFDSHHHYPNSNESSMDSSSDSLVLSDTLTTVQSIDQNSSIVVSGVTVQQSNSIEGWRSASNNNNTTYTNSNNNNAKNTMMDNVQIVQVTQNGDEGTNKSQVSGELRFEFRPMLGICLPKAYRLSWFSVLWTTTWIIFILIAPMCTLLVCDLAVLSIARRQTHRILLAMTMVTITAQATVTRSKGMAPTPPTGLWVNNVPARSRACRAVCEDLTTLILLHLPLILILITEMLTQDHFAPETLFLIGSLSLFAAPSFNALLYGIRARPLRAAYKSYLRKRLTNTTLQHEIQNRLSPVDGSPRPSSRQGKSFRSSTPSPNSSPIQTPRRLSTNDLRPPPNQLILTSSPSHDHIGRHHHHHHNHHHQEEEGNSTAARKVRSFLHIPSFPSQLDLQEFWSGLRRPNRSPTIVITHELIIKKDSSSSILGSPSDAEQRL